MLQMLPYRASELTEWFNECESVVNHMLWLSQSRDLKAN